MPILTAACIKYSPLIPPEKFTGRIQPTFIGGYPSNTHLKKRPTAPPKKKTVASGENIEIQTVTRDESGMSVLFAVFLKVFSVTHTHIFHRSLTHRNFRFRHESRAWNARPSWTNLSQIEGCRPSSFQAPSTCRIRWSVLESIKKFEWDRISTVTPK